MPAYHLKSSGNTCSLELIIDERGTWRWALCRARPLAVGDDMNSSPLALPQVAPHPSLIASTSGTLSPRSPTMFSCTHLL